MVEKKDRKKNHGFGALCHPFFMVLERAALSTHGRKLIYKEKGREKQKAESSSRQENHGSQ